MTGTTSRWTGRGRDATLLVALAAALWGLDGLLRKPLATTLDAATVVFWEHLIAVLVLLPFVPGALRAMRRCSLRDQAAVVVIGVGSSATATVMFTKAFALAAEHYDYVTPLVLQQLQPIIAVALAVVILGERLRPTYALYAVPALIGAWFLALPKPFDPQVSALTPALLALGAAVLWAAGTVLGRLVGFSLTPREVTTLRYVFGLLGAAVAVRITGAPYAAGWHNAVGLVLLALIPGLLALWLYYRGLANTAASRATLAELAFPATAAVVGVLFLGTHLVASQWVGLVIVAASVVGLGLHEQRRRQAVTVPQQPAKVAAVG
jgi:drug/metabolite transporter, DME family